MAAVAATGCVGAPEEGEETSTAALSADGSSSVPVVATGIGYLSVTTTHSDAYGFQQAEGSLYVFADNPWTTAFAGPVTDPISGQSGVNLPGAYASCRDTFADGQLVPSAPVAEDFALVGGRRVYRARQAFDCVSGIADRGWLHSLTGASSIRAGRSFNAQVCLDVPAPAGGVTVELGAYEPESAPEPILGLPSSVAVAGGSSCATFTVTTSRSFTAAGYGVRYFAALNGQRVYSLVSVRL